MLDKIFIVSEPGGDWHYYPAEAKYRRFAHGTKTGEISGKYLPNPDMLLARRRERYPDAKLKDITPHEATYALWSDWNARQKIAG